MKRILARLWRDNSGMAVIEFALVAPILFILAAGTIEAGRLILLTQKLQSGSFILADLAARDRTLSEEQMANIFLALANIIEPFEFTEEGTAFVTSVRGAAGGNAPTISWQRNGAGDLEETSEVGVAGGVATLPEEIALSEDETLIVAEVFYSYEPFITLVSGGQTIRKVAYFKPRLGTLTSILP